MPKYYNVVVLAKKQYTDGEGNNKTTWYKVGHIKVTPTGAQYLTLYMLPDVEFQIFESEKPKE